MGLDVRVPLGLLFLTIGTLLAAYGFSTTGSAIYAKSLEVNLNLIWGSILMLIGMLALWMGRKSE